MIKIIFKRKIISEQIVPKKLNISNLGLNIHIDENVCMTLYDAKALEDICNLIHESYNSKNLEDEKYKEISDWYAEINSPKLKHYRTRSGVFGDEPERADLVHFMLLERNAILGYLEMKKPTEKAFGSFEVWRIGAEKGYGTFLFDLAMAYASLQHHPIMIDRGEVSKEAANMVSKYINRRDVASFPEHLRKYGHLIGYKNSGNESELQKRSFDQQQDKTPQSFKADRWQDRKDVNFSQETRMMLDRAYYSKTYVSDLKDLQEKDISLRKEHRRYLALDPIKDAGLEFFFSKKAS